MKYKNYLHYAVMAVCLSIGIVSCQDDAVDPLTGMFPEPTVLDLNTLTDEGVTEGGGMNVFNIKMSDGNNTATFAVLGKKYFLESGTYTQSHNYERNSFLASSSKVIVAGVEHAIDRGSLSVQKENEHYTISAMVWLDDQTPVKMTSEGDLTYVRKPSALVNVIQADIKPIDATSLYQVYLAIGDAGVTGTVTGGNAVYEGSGYLANVTLITSTPELSTGIYTAADAVYNGPAEQYTAGTFLKGYTYNYEIFGMVLPLPVFSLWTTMVEGQQVESKFIDTGSIGVVKIGDNYMITIDNGDDLYALYAGEIKFNAPTPAVSDNIIYTDNITNSDDPASDEHTVAIKKGETTLAQFVFRTEKDASSLAGTYEFADPCTSAGQLSKGVDFFGYAFGSYYNAEGVNYYINGGTLVITESEGKLSFVLSGASMVDANGATGGKTELSYTDIAK